MMMDDDIDDEGGRGEEMTLLSSPVTRPLGLHSPPPRLAFHVCPVSHATPFAALLLLLLLLQRRKHCFTMCISAPLLLRLKVLVFDLPIVLF